MRCTGMPAGLGLIFAVYWENSCSRSAEANVAVSTVLTTAFQRYRVIVLEERSMYTGGDLYR